jgi:hypothetical protein
MDTIDLGCECCRISHEILPSISPKRLCVSNIKYQIKQTKHATFKIKQTSVTGEINNRKIRIQVYAIEVQNKDTRLAEKLLMKHEEDPVKFVSFRIRKIKSEAY